MKSTHRFLCSAACLGIVASFLLAAPPSYRWWVYNDRQAAGIEAFRVLVPERWETQGGIQWVLDNPALPAVAALRIYDPRGSEEVEVFSTKMFFWSNNPSVMSLFPVGSRYFGAEVRPVLSPGDYIRTILIPSHRQGATHLRIVGQKSLPDLARLADAAAASQPGFSNTADGGMVKIEYENAGRTMEEEIYAVVWSFTFPVQSFYGAFSHTSWYGDFAFSFKAAKGKLASSTATFTRIVTSFVVNPIWRSMLTQVVENSIQMQIQRNWEISRMGSYYAWTGSQIREQNMRSWEHRQRAYDRMASEFSRSFLGEDQNHGPDRRRREMRRVN
jgi:hypothetical protein